jgi:leucyl aminopeptidase
MQIKIQKALKKDDGLLVVPFFKDYEKAFPAQYNEELKALVKRALKDKEFEGKLKEDLFFTVDSTKMPQKVMFIGCAKCDGFSASDARNIGAAINTEAQRKKQQKVTILLTSEVELYAQELIEGLILKNYRISKYKTGKSQKEEDKKEVKTVMLITTKDKLKDKVRKAEAIAQAVNLTKDLVNGPANIVDADYFERIARQVTKPSEYQLKVLDIAKLRKLKWGGLLSINQGAHKPAKCIMMKYSGAKASEKPIVLVGKGVIFDTGGYNLKPTKHIEDMHSDKAGASAVMGVFAALNDLRIKQNVIAILPMTENMIDGKAVRPSDIVTMLNGQTVEIGNTDAEGRMILADGLTEGASKDPRYMIDIATLTGAAMVALGDRYSAVLGNNKGLKERLLKAGEETEDMAWELPLHKDHIEKMKSQVADIRNADAGSSYLAGASKGAAFLSFFIKNKKGKEMDWAHIDIGGTAYTGDPKPYEQKGATGAGVRLLLNFLESL